MMKKADLSILIPGRNELFMQRTIENVLANTRGETEIIAVCDGGWPPIPLEKHPRVHVLYQPVAVGQRAATNRAARLSNARYIMKLDAHCAVDVGFDEVLMADAERLGREVTQIPAMINLHAFDWKCTACGHRIYQGPTPVEGCAKCHAPMARDILWKPRFHKRTEYWRFDSTLHFQYHGAFKTRPEAKDEIVDVMTSIGACFFLRRDRYFELGGLDEGHGSWGQCGVEIACKSWLSGGRHVVNKKTWFAHMFRTQGGTIETGFTFPYPISGNDVEKARKHSRNLWLKNRWPGQVLPLSWLIEKFKPVPDWHEATGAEQLAKVTAQGESFLKQRRKQSLPIPQVVGALPNPIASQTSAMPIDGRGQLVAVTAMGTSGTIGGHPSATQNVDTVRDQVDVSRIDTPLVVTNHMIENRDVLTGTDRQLSDQPCVEQSVNAVELFVDANLAVTTVPASTKARAPEPAPSSAIDTDLGENSGQPLRIEMGNGEILLRSHSGPPLQEPNRSEPLSRGKRESGSKSIVFYTDSRLDPTIASAVRRQLLKAQLPIISVSLKPLDFGTNLVLPLERSYLTMFQQILAGLEASTSDYVFFCEHDCLYHPTYFDFTPPSRSKYFYNRNVWKVNAETGDALFYLCDQTSGLCAARDLLLTHYRARVARVAQEGFTRHMGFEPGTRKIRHGGVDDVRHETWMAPIPTIDIRHGRTLTPSRWRQDQFRNQKFCQGWTESARVPGWGPTQGRFAEFLADVSHPQPVALAIT